MANTIIPGAHGADLSLTWGGESDTHPDEVFVAPAGQYRGRYVKGEALRDALIEAFPLPEAEDAEGEDVDYDAIPTFEGILAAAEEYAAPRAARAYATAVADFVASVHPLDD